MMYVLHEKNWQKKIRGFKIFSFLVAREANRRSALSML